MSVKGRAIFEMYESGVQVHKRSTWVKNYIAVHQDVVEGRYISEEADWAKAALCLKKAGDPWLARVQI